MFDYENVLGQIEKIELSLLKAVVKRSGFWMLIMTEISVEMQKIEKELFQWLQTGTYGDIYNFPVKEYEKVLAMEEMEAADEEEDVAIHKLHPGQKLANSSLHLIWMRRRVLTYLHLHFPFAFCWIWKQSPSLNLCKVMRWRRKTWKILLQASVAMHTDGCEIWSLFSSMSLWDVRCVLLIVWMDQFFKLGSYTTLNYWWKHKIFIFCHANEVS